MFYIFVCLTDVKKLPEDDLGKISTCRRFEGFYVKIYIIVTYSAFVGIT